MLSVQELVVISTSTFDQVKSILLVSNVLFFFNPSVSVDEKNRLVTWNWGGGLSKVAFHQGSPKFVYQLSDHCWDIMSSPSPGRLFFSH